MDTTITNEQEKRGLSICVISRGTLPTIWVQYMFDRVTKHIPSGVFWNLIWKIGTPETNGKNYAQLRNECIEEAKRRNSKWVLFVDDDVFIPETAVKRLLFLASQGHKVISGIYYKKSESIEPVIFKQLGNGPYYDFPINEIFEIEGSGAGCLWIDLEIFKKFEENNLPYFKQDWILQLDDKGKDLVQVEIGEDHWLFYQAKKLGFNPVCDSSIMCDHYCSKQNKTFPGEAECSRIRGAELSNQEVWKNKISKLRETEKPLLVFLCPTSMNFDGSSIENKPIGGSETAVINIAKRLTPDYNVVVVCNCARQEIYDGVLYIDLKSLDLLTTMQIEKLVIYRANSHEFVSGIKKKLKPKNIYFWTQDYPMYPGFNPDFPALTEEVDKVICVSNDHKKALLDRYPLQIKEEKITVIENGVDESLFKPNISQTKKTNQFYYSSTPYRGLEVLLDVFPDIKKAIPDATLKVCSSMKVYGDDITDKQYQAIYDRMKTMDGVEYLGSMKQKELAEVAKASQMLLYPSVFAETSCITAMEAQTAMSPIVCSDLGALKETVQKGCGIVIPGNPKTKEWKDAFVKSVIDVCTNVNKLTALVKNCEKQKFSWDRRVVKWKNLLK